RGGLRARRGDGAGAGAHRRRDGGARRRERRRSRALRHVQGDRSRDDARRGATGAQARRQERRVAPRRRGRARGLTPRSALSGASRRGYGRAPGADIDRGIRLRSRAARCLASMRSFVRLAPRAGGGLLAGLAFAALAAAPAGAPRADVANGPRRIVLKPEDRAGWSPAQIFSAMNPNAHAARTLRVETSPPGATLDLFYVRASFQKRYEQAQAPVVLELPSRAEAGKRDS